MGPVFARRRSHVRGARGPCRLQFSQTLGARVIGKHPSVCKTCAGEYRSKAKADMLSGFRPGNFRASAGGGGVGTGCRALRLLGSCWDQPPFPNVAPAG